MAIPQVARKLKLHHCPWCMCQQPRLCTDGLVKIDLTKRVIGKCVCFLLLLNSLWGCPHATNPISGLGHDNDNDIDIDR